MGKVSDIIKAHWAILIAILFVITSATYLCIVRDGVIIQVHDTLDEPISLYKMMKDGHLFWSFGTKAPFLGGIDRDYLYSDLKLYSWLYMFFPSLMALLIGWYLTIILSIFGFAKLGRLIYGETRQNTYILCGLLYGIIPTATVSSFDFASIPILIALIVQLYRDFNWKYLLAFLIFPVLSQFAMCGLLICGYLFCFFLGDWIINKRPMWRLLIAVMALSLGYVITEWRLFYITLFSKEESIRTTFIPVYLSWREAAETFKTVLLEGQYHSGDLHKFFILPICAMFFVVQNGIYIIEKDFKRITSDAFNWLTLLQIVNCMLYTINGMEWFKELVGSLIPPLQGYSFARALWFSPFIWYFSFMIILCRFDSKPTVTLVSCAIAFFVLCFCPEVYNNIRGNSRIALRLVHAHHNKESEATVFNDIQELSFGEYYSTELFDEIKETIAYNGEWSVAFGMHPGVLHYNGISTLDGYLSYYPAEYKAQFRKLIAPELDVDPYNEWYYDSWGGRAYIFSNEVSYAPLRTVSNDEALLLIDPKVFHEMGGKYVFSRFIITNADELAFNYIGEFHNDKSPYTVYVYNAL